MSTVLLLDNYDSFTYILNDYLLSAGLKTIVIRNDPQHWENILQLSFEAIVISPGPGTPQNAGCCMQLIQHFYTQKPILGICLGHQALGCFFGANLIRAPKPTHGFTSQIKLIPHPMWNNIPSSIEVMRYHSLLLEDIPETLVKTGETMNKELMAFAHREFPCWGIQFHPESALSQYGAQLIRNWKTNFRL